MVEGVRNTREEKSQSSRDYSIEYGIKSDFVLASSSVPINYEYTRLKVEDHKSKGGSCGFVQWVTRCEHLGQVNTLCVVLSYS